MAECDLLKVPLLPIENFNNDLIKVFDILKKSDRILLENRYNELQFIDKLSQSYKCIQCAQISFSPYVALCGHVFCDTCKDVHTMCEKNVYTCPKCLTFEPEITQRNAGLQLKVLSLSVMCPNNLKGCEFSTMLMEMPNHIRECDEKFDMKNPTFIPISQLKNDLEAILRNLELKYLQLENTITLILASEMRKLSLAIEAHRNYITVKGKAIDDAFSYINTRLSRLNEAEILTRLKNSQIRKRKVVYVQEKFNSKLEPTRCFIPLTSTVYTWVIPDVSQVKKGNLSINFPLNGRPILVQVELRYRPTSGRLDLQLTTTSDNDNILATPYPRVTFTLRYLKIFESIILNEKTSETKWYTEETEEYLFSKVEDIKFKQPLVYNCSFDGEVFQNIDGSLTIFISIDFPHLIEKSSLLNGSVLWGIKNFMKIIENAENNSDSCYYSPYFYSGESGFRMKVELNAANYLSNILPFKIPFCRIPLIVRIVTGENDSAISDQFKIDCSLGVLNHEDNLIPVDQATTTEAYCTLRLLTLHQMQQYLKNDTLWVVIAVNSIN